MILIAKYHTGWGILALYAYKMIQGVREALPALSQHMMLIMLSIQTLITEG